MLVKKTSSQHQRTVTDGTSVETKQISKIANIKHLELVDLIVKSFFMSSKEANTVKVSKVCVIGKGVLRGCIFSCPYIIDLLTNVWSFFRGEKIYRAP